VTGGALPASAAALLVLLCATWGLGQVAVKIGLEGISPLVQAGLRSAVAVPLLLLWCRLRGIPVFLRDGSLPAGLLSGALFAAEFWAIYEALALTTAARSTVLVFTAPFWAVLGAHLLVPGDRLTARKLAGLGLAFAGLLVAFGDRLGAPADAMLAGDLLALLGGMLWGATIVVMKATRLTRIAAERTLLYQIGTAGLLLPLGLALGEPGVFAPTPLVWGALAFQGVVVAFASYAAWFWLVAKHKASALAPFLFLTPVFAVLAGALLLGEPVTPPLVGALVLIGAGIWVVNRA
jgi:drug/metabolite transporter (DMT)-like permease